MNLNKNDKELLHYAVRKAGDYALSVRQTASKTAWNKAKNDPVTEADIAVNDMLETTLMAARPEYGWLSEETADEPNSRMREKTWVVDPIDGTRAYMRIEDPYWCVGVSVVQNNRPILSAVYAPSLNRFYHAQSGVGAFVNGKKLEKNYSKSSISRQIIIGPRLLQRLAIENSTVVNPKPCAMLLRLALVADGTYDGVVVLGAKSDWDIAAGSLLVEETGGRASTQTNEDFAFNNTVPEQKSIVAANTELHTLLIDKISKIKGQ